MDRTSLCIAAAASFACMIIKLFLVDLKDEFGEGGQRKRGEKKGNKPEEDGQSKKRDGEMGGVVKDSLMI